MLALGLGVVLAAGCAPESARIQRATVARRVEEPAPFDFAPSDRQFQHVYAGLLRLDDVRIEELSHGERARILRATALRPGSFSISKVYQFAPNHPDAKGIPLDESDVFTLVIEVLPRGEVRYEVDSRTVLCVGDQIELQVRVEQQYWRTRSFAWLPPLPAAPWRPPPLEPSCTLDVAERTWLGELAPRLTSEIAFCTGEGLPDILGRTRQYVTLEMKAGSPGDVPELGVLVAPPKPIVVTPKEWTGTRVAPGRAPDGKQLEDWKAHFVLRPGDTFRHVMTRYR
jgi:hypothetical protein